jgi:hypothetical protein
MSCVISSRYSRRLSAASRSAASAWSRRRTRSPNRLRRDSIERHFELHVCAERRSVSSATPQMMHRRGYGGRRSWAREVRGRGHSRRVGRRLHEVFDRLP